MQMKGALAWAWFLNLGVPLMLIGFAYGCGGKAYLSSGPLLPSSTALEGRAMAEGLASHWDASARLVGVAGWRVGRDGRLAEKPDSLWVYTFSRPGNDGYYEVKRDGRGAVDAGPVATVQTQSLWAEPFDAWQVDSPAVAATVTEAQLPLGETLDMQITRDGVWRVTAEDGRFLREIQIDAGTGRRILSGVVLR